MHLQKHSHDYDSAAGIVDANDSGFSEIYHTCEREDATQISSQALYKRPTTDEAFNKVSIQCSSTPKRSSSDYLYQQMALSSGLQECTVETMAPFARMPNNTGSCYTESVSPPKTKTEAQFEEGNKWINSQPAEMTALYRPHNWLTDCCVEYQPGSCISDGSQQAKQLKDGNICTGFKSDRKKNIVSTETPKLHKGNPMKIEIGLIDTFPSIDNVQRCADLPIYAGLRNNSEVIVGGIADNKKPSKLTDMLFQDESVQPATLPILDLKSSTAQAIGHVLKSPSFIRPMAMTLPQRIQFPNTNISSVAVQTIDLSCFSSMPYTAPSMPDSMYNTNILTNSTIQAQRVSSLNHYNSRRSLQYVIASPKAVSCMPYSTCKFQSAPRFASEFGANYVQRNLSNDLAYGPAVSNIDETHASTYPAEVFNIAAFDSKPKFSCEETLFKQNNSDREDSFAFQRSVKCESHAFFTEFSGKSKRARRNMSKPTDGFAPQYSDISTEDSHTDSPVASESSCDETSRGTPMYVIRKNKKLKRKSLTPRRSPDKRDPKFKGVTIWLQTEFKHGKSHLHLSAFYSNVKTSITKPACELSKTKIIHSDSEAEVYFPPTPSRETYGTIKTCASCRTRRTPLWRDAEDGTPLCNACGIRYKKYRLRCSRCWFIPKKDIKTYPNCPACGSALRYSFHRKSW